MTISFRSSHHRNFYLLCALIFVASAAGTIYWCASMSGGMPMPGDWTMSMAWMRMPGQSVVQAAVLFLAMWLLMMVAMMLPSITPMLAKYYDSHRSFKRTFIAAASYFLVWEVLGVAAYAAGMAIVTAESAWPHLSRLVPIAIGMVLLLAGIFQLSSFKTRHLAQCCDSKFCGTPAGLNAKSAWQFGVRLGIQCALCCAAFMTILLVIGVMDIRLMAILAAAIAIERWWPQPHRIARLSGILMILAGLLMLVR